MTTTAAASDTSTGTVDALVDRLLEENDPADAIAFRGAQYDLGLAWVSFPAGFGGLGLAPDLQRRVEDRIRAAGVRADALERNGFGIFLAAPTIAAHASDELKARLLRPLFINRCSPAAVRGISTKTLYERAVPRPSAACLHRRAIFTND